jgi:hypothetical protein
MAPIDPLGGTLRIFRETVVYGGRLIYERKQ